MRSYQSFVAPHDPDSVDSLLREMTLTHEPVTNMDTYLSGMTKGVQDKLFFMNLIQPDLIVDFGAADGFVLNEIKKRRPFVSVLGYDISPDMITQAHERHPNIPMTSHWSEVEAAIKKHRKPCLLLSSVIHEVYSYSNEEGVARFWREILSAGFEFIVVRDTIPKRDIELIASRRFRKDVIQVKQVVRMHGDDDLLHDYEDRWGPIDQSYKNLVRFILMYRYKENWSRERLEDYLPVSYEELLDQFLVNHNQDYRVIYDKSFKFKPIQRAFDVDFGVSLRTDLHLKLILRKK